MSRPARDGLNWTHDEVVFALGLYFQIPWGKINQRNPVVMDAAKLLKRTAASLGRKMGNLGRFDPTLAARGVGGLKNGAKMDKIVWEEFADHRENLASEYDRIRTQLQGHELVAADDDLIKTPPGLEGVRLTKYRKNQSFFRQSVLSAYNGACCITGINDSRLLVASHIRPWSKCKNGEDRTKTENGLCLSALYDRAFDKGLFTVDRQFKIKLSSTLKDHLTTAAYNQHFAPLDNRQITMPSRGKPAAEFLNYHNSYVFVA